MRTSRVCLTLALLVCATARLSSQAAKPHRPLIIDMHFHALAADFAGPPPATTCAPIATSPEPRAWPSGPPVDWL